MLNHLEKVKEIKNLLSNLSGEGNSLARAIKLCNEVANDLEENNKAICYQVTYSGVDGRETPKVEFASFSEKERNDWLKTAKNKNYYSTNEVIIDVGAEEKKAKSKLNGLEKLLLGVK